jgi:hypothetical protein
MLRQSEGIHGMQDLRIQDYSWFLMILCTESMVHLIRNAGPLAPIVAWLRGKTPCLYSEAQGQHLLDCGYCLSVWCAAGAYFLVGYRRFWIAELLIVILVVHRLSNFLHLGFSYLRDKQLDLRVARNRRD